MKTNSQCGQSLVELVVGIAVGILFIVAALGIITLSLRIDLSNTVSQTGSELAQEVSNNLESFANADWDNVSSLATLTEYHLDQSNPFLPAIAGRSAPLSLNGHDFEVYFTVEEVKRSSVTNQIDSGGVVDPSTLLVTAVATWDNKGEADSVEIKKYIVRTRNSILRQIDWSGSSDQYGPFIGPIVGTDFATSTNASTTGSSAGYITIAYLSTTTNPSPGTNIDLVDKWAWNDIIGWINFYETGNVNVSDTGLSGYANSSAGEIVLDCADAPGGSVCGNSSFSVANDTVGNLSGWAWNDIVGWISFCGDFNGDGSCDSDPDYQVTIDGNGDFRGLAWNDIVGWISFNCLDTPGGCATVSYKVKTSWNAPAKQATLTSSVLDTEVIDGASFNTIMWLGTVPVGTPSSNRVRFQLKSSDTDDAALRSENNFIGPLGGEVNDYYNPAQPGDQVGISRQFHNNHRYIRYKVFLFSDNTNTITPEVDEIIINFGS